MIYYLVYYQTSSSHPLYQLTAEFKDVVYLAAPRSTPLEACTTTITTPSTSTTIAERIEYIAEHRVRSNTPVQYLGPVSDPADFQSLYPEHFL